MASQVATTTKQELPYGAWPSPISAKAIAGATLSFAEALVDPTSGGLIYHLEGRPSEGGRVVLVDDATGRDVTPEGSNTRTGVHGYGGGAAAVRHGRAIMSDIKSSSVFARDRTTDGQWSDPVHIVPENAALRYADFDVHPTNRDLILAVCEDHTVDEPSKVVTTIVSIDASARKTSTIATGADFYSAPRWSPDGSRIAFVSWHHPNMPWDGTTLSVTDADGKGSPHVIAGSHNISISQPRWSLDIKRLLFLSDETGYSQLSSAPASGNGKPELVLSSGPTSFDQGPPDWLFGYSTFAPIDDDLVVARTAPSELSIISLSRRVIHRIIPTPYRVMSAIRRVSASRIALIGVGATTPASLVTFDWTQPNLSFEVLKVITKDRVDPAFVSAAKSIVFPAGPDPGSKERVDAHALLYVPVNGNITPRVGEKPPCLVRCHGGPTSAASPAFALDIQWWTSRGWGYVDVDYGGSTGYGRAYRDRLHGNWGIVDKADTIACVDWLVKEGHVDPKRIAIAGGSAGGFTVLAALTSSKVFAAGCSLYGVAELTALAKDTHKFESQYLFGCVGGTPEEIPEVYKDRSPLTHASNITAAMLVLQGSEDKVVPPNQATAIYEAAKANGSKCELKIYEGEGHGFRRSENIEDALTRQHAFFCSAFGIEVVSAATAASSAA